MYPFLYKYLILHNHVSIPGIGQFSIEKQPAKIDADSNLIYPPASTIAYKNEADTADKSFYNFLAKEMKIEVVDAIRQFQDFAYKLKNKLSHEKNVELPAMGLLSVQSGTIHFEPQPVSTLYFPVVNLKDAQYSNGNNLAEVTEYEDEYEHTSRSNWWIYALILGAIAIAAIVYYYMNEMSY